MKSSLNVCNHCLISKIIFNIQELSTLGRSTLLKFLKIIEIQTYKIQPCLSVGASHDYFIIGPTMEPLGFN